MVIFLLFLAHLAHQFASVVRRQSRRPSSYSSLTFTKSSPLKVLGQIKQNLATIIIGVLSFKNVSGDQANEQKWPPWLRIEHSGKM